METSEVPNQLLKDKYQLHKAPEVETVVRRTQMRTSEKVPQDPLIRIQNYLNRFHEIIDRGVPERREHNLDLIKGLFHRKYVIRPKDISDSFWENQKRILRERGQGADLEQVDWEELKRQNTEAIIADQRSSLDKWIDYLSSPDAPYSDALKYFTLRSVLNMGEYDKEKKIYPQRSKGTTKPFPDLNREALAYVLDAIAKKYQKTKFDMSSLGETEAKEFEKLLAGENFAKLYAFAIEKVTPSSPEALTATSGEWIKYSRRTNHMPLVASLQGHGTGWCTAGELTAETQLKGGDFYIYYSLDNYGKPTIPRAAIRMEGSSIAEVRGIAAEQNLDGGIAPIVDEKLKEFPDRALYQKKVADMKRLTDIERKAKEGEILGTSDLTFLYEIENPIKGFGYYRDPRIAELRATRNPQEDMPIVFNCSRKQIAGRVSEIRPDTKAYVGPLEPDIFDKLQGLEHVYTSFPEGKIRIEDLAIGGRPKKQLRKDLRRNNIRVSLYAKDEIKHSDFTTLPTSEVIKTVRLRVQDLGFKNGATTAEIIGTKNDVDEYGKPSPFTKGRMTQLGLHFCLPEVSVYQRLKDANQLLRAWYYIAMKPITDRSGHPSMLRLDHYEDGLWLATDGAFPDYRWDPGTEFVFALRKSEPQTLQRPGFFDRFFRH